MFRNLGIIFILFVTHLFLGCASTYKDFKTEKVKYNEGIAIGKVDIKYNGKKFNPKCSVCLNSVNGPCQKLTDNGFIFQNIPKGNTTLSRIVCKDVSLQHYNITNANFQVDDQVTYFGHVEIEWQNKGGFKSSDMFGLVGALMAESKNDGTVKISVKSGDSKPIISEFQQQTGQQKVKFDTNLVKVAL